MSVLVFESLNMLSVSDYECVCLKEKRKSVVLPVLCLKDVSGEV